jgi:hypothetical protein
MFERTDVFDTTGELTAEAMDRLAEQAALARGFTMAGGYVVLNALGGSFVPSMPLAGAPTSVQPSPGSNSTLTVRDITGNPSYPNVDIIDTDFVSGLAVVSVGQAGSHEVHISCIPTSAGQQGVVSTVYQVLGNGVKAFSQPVQMLTNQPLALSQMTTRWTGQPGGVLNPGISWVNQLLTGEPGTSAALSVPLTGEAISAIYNDIANPTSLATSWQVLGPFNTGILTVTANYVGLPGSVQAAQVQIATAAFQYSFLQTASRASLAIGAPGQWGIVLSCGTVVGGAASFVAIDTHQGVTGTGGGGDTFYGGICIGLGQAPITQGTLAARPPASTAGPGALYLTTDTSPPILYYSNGTTWLQVGSSGTTPAAPTGLAATAANAQAALSWTGSTGATSYNVYRATNSGMTGATLVATGQTNTNYTATGLTNGTQYWFAVTAVGSGGAESAFSSVVSATPAAGQALSLNASTGFAFAYMTLPAGFKTSAFSVSFWVKNISAGTYKMAAEPEGAANDGRGWGLTVSSSTVIFSLGSASGAFTALTASGLNLNDGSWHHVVATYDGTNSAIYIDGVSSASASPGITINWTDNAAFGPVPATFYVGANHNSNATGPTTTADLSGQATILLDEMQIYSRAISSSEVTTLYNGGSGTVLTLSNCVSSYKFDSTVNDSTGSNNLTIFTSGAGATSYVTGLL